MILQRICLKWIDSRVIHALILALRYTTRALRHAHHQTSLRTRRTTLRFPMYGRRDRKCPKRTIRCIVEVKWLVFDRGWVQRAELTSSTTQKVFWVSVDSSTTMGHSGILHFRVIAHGCWPPYTRGLIPMSAAPGVRRGYYGRKLNLH